MSTTIAEYFTTCRVLQSLPLLLFLAATSAVAGVAATAPNVIPQPRDYRTLGPSPRVPYVWEREAHGKHLVVIGSQHLRDPRSPMFDAIERIFDHVEPQIVLHESRVPDAIATMPRNEAIRIGADAGFTVWTARRRGAEIRSGDVPQREEIAALLRLHPSADVFVFLVVQRLIGTDQAPDWSAAEAGYADFYTNTLVGNGLPPNDAWRTWPGFLAEYCRVVGTALSPAEWNPAIASPFHKGGRLSELARGDDEVRDRYLLDATREALRAHDRVIVVFGGAHVRVLEPVLATLLD